MLTRLNLWITLMIFVNTNIFVNATGIKLEDNTKFEEIDCNSLYIESYCTTPSVHGWCKWNNDLSICQPNYEPTLFISTWDIAVLPKSSISFIVLSAFMLLWFICGLITQNLKIFKDIEANKRLKCQIYLFEMIGLTISLCYLLAEGTLNIIFFPQQFSNMGPTDTVNLMRSLSSAVMVMYMYLIEMLAGNLRASVKLHHLIVISTGLYYFVLLDGHADIASLRSMVAISLYPLSEHNIFVTLFIYRINPLFSWQWHMISGIIYLLTRLMTVVIFTYTWISWAYTDTIYNQFHGNEDFDVFYMIFFFVLPIVMILLLLAQFQTMKAVYYITKSTQKRIAIYNDLVENPRLQILYDIFIEFEHNGNGYWTMNDFNKFVTHYSEFVKDDTVKILWNTLGFMSNEELEMMESEQNGDTNISRPNGHGKRMRSQSNITEEDLAGFEDKMDIKERKKKYMKWKDFRSLFAEHVLDEQWVYYYSVKEIVTAQLQVLIQIIFNAESQVEQEENDAAGARPGMKDKIMLKLYNDMNTIVMNGGVLKLTDDQSENNNKKKKRKRKDSRLSKRLKTVMAAMDFDGDKGSNDNTAEYDETIPTSPTIEMFIGSHSNKNGSNASALPTPVPDPVNDDNDDNNYGNYEQEEEEEQEEEYEEDAALYQI